MDVPKYEKLTNRTFTETFDLARAKTLIRCWDQFKTYLPDERLEHIEEDENYDPLIHLKKMVKNSSKTSTNLVRYSFSKNHIKAFPGRLYERSASLQKCQREVRAFISYMYDYDIDIVNAHPTFLYQYCNKKGIECSILKQYIEHRDEYFQEWFESMGWSRDTSKNKMLCVMNGKEINNPDLYPESFLKLYQELRNIISNVVLHNSDIMKIIKRRKKNNTEGSCLNIVLCDIENLVLYYIVEWFDNNNFQVDTLSFDGCMVRKNPSNIITPEVLTQVEIYVKEKTDYDIKLLIKPMIPIVEIEQLNQEDDNNLYENVKLNFEKTHFKIRHPPMIVSNLSKGYVLQNVKSFIDSYMDITTDLYDDKTNEKSTISFVPKWLKDPSIKCYDYIDFKPPPIKCENSEFNTWTGFKIANEPLLKTERDYYQEFYNYGLNLLGEKHILDFIIARYAFRIQNPGLRTNVCLVLCGLEGDGKNRFLQVFYNIMEGYYTMLDSAKKLYDTHSMYEKDKLFILINEAGGNANFENADVLKTRITENELSINPKGIQSYTIRNLCDYDNTTNNQNVLKLTDDSFRRFLQVETTSYYSGNDVFFTDYITNIENNPIALRQIYEHLKNFDIKSVIPSGNFQKDKPTTAIEAEVKRQNRDKILWFFDDYVRLHKRKPVIKVQNDILFSEWNKWCERSKVKIEYNKIQFGIKISQLIKKHFNKNDNVYIVKDTKHSTTIIYTEKMREFFGKLNNINYLDESDDENTIEDDDTSSDDSVQLHSPRD